MFRLLTPHFRVNSVLELTVNRLRELGIDCLLLDVDCTLKRYRENDIRPEVMAWLDALKTSGIGCCIVSNGRGTRIRQFAEKIGLPYIAKALKPLPLGIHLAIKKTGSKPDHTAMVGDQVFADVLASRLAGVKSILVSPMHPEEEPWFTRLKRPPERLLLRWLGQGKKKKKNGLSA